ncbi:MAG: response regulator transcription factor [Prevotellaceae bacterium]|jgi:two-component system alkaline phosphatase synthesis response regulator PhoP|nr:response regulator transcription factor [Prevotellaceae bacterium]
MSAYRILLVDDENDILEFLSYALRKEGYEVHTVNNGSDCIRMALDKLPHLILLDVMMPVMDGIVTCEEIRRHKELATTVIAFLTARGEDYSQIAGFEAGGDDYIIKPIRPKVLISRIKALLKRFEQDPASAGTRQQQVQVGHDLFIDRERFLIIFEGKELTIPKKEFELLELLSSRPQKVFSRDEIFTAVWGNDIIVGERTIDVHIRKLREKIGDNYIKTLKGVGYKFINEP